MTAHTGTDDLTYVHYDGSLCTDQDMLAVRSVEALLLSGAYFRNVATGARSSIGYRPPITRSDWSHCMQTVARMAAESDAFAQLARAIIGRVNLYGTDPQAIAAVYDAAAKALDEGYDDVLGRSGPGAGRWSDHQRAFNLRERVLLAYWLAEATAPFVSHLPGVGWPTSVLARAHNISIERYRFTRLKSEGGTGR